MRYFEKLFNVQPQLLSNLSKEEFKKMHKEFYKNQAIILTLPFEKP
jgi:hypothetical protein